MNKFFVYGTLMEGLSNHHVIDRKMIDQIDLASIENTSLYNHIYGYFPCLIEGDETTQGELITIKEEFLDEAIKKLDQLEGYRGKGNRNNFYNRIVKQIILEDGTKIKAYVYMYNLKNHPILGEKILCGSYKEYLIRRQKGER